MAEAAATKHGDEPDPLDSTGLCLLSLDGGGVRGLSTLYILKNLMDQMNYTRKAADLDPVKPCEIFDLIGGTGTGGVIAIMLGRLAMDVDECITQYNNLMKKVFGGNSEAYSMFCLSWLFKSKAQFDPKNLKSAVEEMIRSKGFGPTDAFNDIQELGCRTFVCSAAKETSSVTRLRSYTVPDERDLGLTICEAALATSATTGFFDPVTVGARQFVDGALGANNPVDEVEGEAANIWSAGTGELKPLVKCFISMGTGNPGKKAIDDDAIEFLWNTLTRIVKETEETERKFIARWAKHYDERRYFRFNVDQGLQDVGLTEFNEQGRMEAATDEYLRHQTQKSRVRDCVRNMQQKQGKTDVNFALMMTEIQTRISTHSITAHKTFWNVPFEKNEKFVLRDEVLSEIESKLFQDRWVKVAIHGLGGAGKTQIALELAHQTRQKHRNCSVFWVPATNTASLKQAFAEIGQQLGIYDVEDDEDDEKTEVEVSNKDKKGDARKLVQQHLSQESVGKWMLIVDNVDDMDIWTQDLKDFMPQSRYGQIICTTRSRKIAVKIAQQNIIEVSQLGEESAMQLFKTSLAKKDLVENQEDALKILERLTFLPLAIVQATAYINENGINLTDYLSLLDECEEDVVDLLSEEFEDEGRYNAIKNPVALTWVISFEHIRKLDPLAAEYLSFMACVDPKGIPQSLLPPVQSRKKVIDAIGTLTGYAFMTRRANNDFDLHRLVHLATRKWLRMKGQLGAWTAKTTKRLDSLFPSSGHENRGIWRTYMPHALFLLHSGDFNMTGMDNLALVERVAECLHSDGRWNEAVSLFEPVMEARKKELGDNHSRTLSSMTNLALTYKNQGRWTEAENLFLKVMESRKETDKEMVHLLTLSSMTNLGMTYRNQGRWADAEELFKSVLDGRKKALGDKHLDTISSMKNLALNYKNQGRWKEAEALLQEVVKERKEQLSPRDPATLASIGNLAWAYRSLGRWNEAEGLELEVLEARKSVLGESHPHTLISLANLALTYRNQGRWKEAEQIFRRVIDTRKRTLGENHLDTLKSMSNLATTYKMQGRWDDAEQLFLKVIAQRTKLLREGHPETLSSKGNLALTYGSQGRWTEAEQLLDHVLQTSKTELGETHPSTLTAMSNLAWAYRNLGRSKEAEEIEIQAMKTRKQVLGEKHTHTLASMANMAQIYKTQGRWKNAEELEVQVVIVRKSELRDGHPDTLSSMSNLATTYQMQGRWKEAEDIFVELVDEYRKELGDEHSKTLNAISNLAAVYRRQGRWKDAKESCDFVMKTSIQVFGENHPSALTAMANVGLVHRSLRQYKEAEELFKKVTDARRESLGEKHPLTLMSMANLSLTVSDQGRWEEAEKLQLDILEARKKELGEEHPDTLTIMGSLASTYKSQKRFEEARELETAALEAKKKKLGEKHPSTLTTMGNLANTYRNLKRYVEAEELEVRVLTVRKEKLGAKHPSTLKAMANLARGLELLGRTEEAIMLMHECAELRKEVLGENHADTKSSIVIVDQWRSKLKGQEG